MHGARLNLSMVRPQVSNLHLLLQLLVKATLTLLVENFHREYVNYGVRLVLLVSSVLNPLGRAVLIGMVLSKLLL